MCHQFWNNVEENSELGCSYFKGVCSVLYFLFYQATGRTSARDTPIYNSCRLFRALNRNDLRGTDRFCHPKTVDKAHVPVWFTQLYLTLSPSMVRALLKEQEFFFVKNRAVVMHTMVLDSRNWYGSKIYLDKPTLSQDPQLLLKLY